MKNLLLFLIFSFLATTAYSQGETTNRLSLIKEDQFSLDVAYNLLLSKPDFMKPVWSSTSFNMNLVRDIPIKDGNFGFATGGILSWNIYNNNLSIETDSSNGLGVYSVLHDSISYKSNKFRTVFIDIPLEFRIRSNNNNNGDYFKFYLGAQVGYLIRSFSEFKTQNIKYRCYNIPEFNKFRYGLTTRIGFSNWNLFIYYQLSSIFNSEKLKNASLDLTESEQNELGEMRPLLLGVSFHF